MHTEYNKKEYLDSKIIKKKIKQGKDLFNRNDIFNKINFKNKIYPEYLIKNRKSANNFYVGVKHLRHNF